MNEHGMCQCTEFMLEQFIFAPCQITWSTGCTSCLYIVIAINQSNTIWQRGAWALNLLIFTISTIKVNFYV
jgi:hypothetical protein